MVRCYIILLPMNSHWQQDYAQGKPLLTDLLLLCCQQGTIDQALALKTNLLPCAAQRQQGCATIVPCCTAAPSHVSTGSGRGVPRAALLGSPRPISRARALYGTQSGALAAHHGWSSGRPTPGQPRRSRR